jgi:hypothetical protein
MTGVSIPRAANADLQSESTSADIVPYTLQEFLGLIWQLLPSSLLLDAGVCKDMNRGTPDWLFTTERTWSFSLSAVASVSSRGGRP